MCTHLSSCLCHLIKPALENDYQEEMKKKYFDPAFCTESYDFLKTAYPLLSKEYPLDLKAALVLLNNQYINEGCRRAVNLAGSEKQAYRETYALFLTNQASDGEMRVALSTLVKSIEQNVYNNFVEHLPVHFNKHLIKYSSSERIIEKLPESTEESNPAHCCIIF